MKIVNTKALLTLIFLAFASSLSAQVEMVWDAHGIGFAVPEDFEITTNTDQEFSAENGGLFITIMPWQDETVTEDGLAETVVSVALEMEYDELTDAAESSIDDFVGYFVEGTKDGVGAVIILLLDKESSTNLVFIAAYVNESDRDTAVDIFQSIYAYDE